MVDIYAHLNKRLASESNNLSVVASLQHALFFMLTESDRLPALKRALIVWMHIDHVI